MLFSYGAATGLLNSDKIAAFLSRVHRCGFAANILTVSERFDDVVRDLFSKRHWHKHCLNIVFTGREKL